MMKNKRNFVSRARKQRGLAREKRNRKNSLRSKMGSQSQSTSSKSGPSVNFGRSCRIVDFCPYVGQLLVNPVPEKKASV